MARLISGRYGRDVYPEVLEDLRRRGARRASRNGLTYALDDYTIELESPLHALPFGCGRGLSARIAAAEALQLIGRFSDPSWLVRIAPTFKEFLEPDGRFWGSYGDRIGDQLDGVVLKLQNDPTTRQAVITLWSPPLDNQTNKRDFPCTVAIGFNLAERDLLNMRVTMRSNDAWLGLPYDMFQFSQLQLTLCNVLDVLPGFYVHTAWSLHLYHQHVDPSYQVAECPPPTENPINGIGRPGIDTINQTSARARLLRDNLLTDRTPSESWYLDTLREML